MIVHASVSKRKQKGDMSAITSQIEVVENEIQTYEDRVDTIEKTVRLKDLTDAQSQTLNEELKHLEKKLKERKRVLSALRKENGKNTALSVAILAVLVGVYYMSTYFLRVT